MKKTKYSKGLKIVKNDRYKTGGFIVSGYLTQRDENGNQKRVRKAFKGTNAYELAVKYKTDLENQDIQDSLRNKSDLRETKIDEQTEFTVVELIRALRDDLNDQDTEGHVLLKKAVDFFLDSPIRSQKEITLSALLVKYEARRNWKKRSKAHTKNFHATIEKLCSYFDSDRDFASITREEVETFLDRRGETSDASFRLEYAHLHAFFEYGKSQNFSRINVVHEIEKPELDKKEPVSLTIDQIVKIFTYADKVDSFTKKWRAKNKRPEENCSTIAYFALAIFCALRPFEVGRALWEDIDWDQGIIRARMRKSGGYTRSVEIPPVCIEWLKFVGGENKTGEITPKNLTKRSAIVRAAAGFRIQPGNYKTGSNFGLDAEIEGSGNKDRPEWVPDVCRHTGITYKLRDLQDKPATALWAGNSPEEIERSYKSIAGINDKTFDEFYKLTPKKVIG